MNTVETLDGIRVTKTSLYSDSANTNDETTKPVSDTIGHCFHSKTMHLRKKSKVNIVHLPRKTKIAGRENSIFMKPLFLK